MINKLIDYLLPSIVKRLASPSQMASIARSALKLVGAYLANLGFSEQAVAGFQAGNESIVAGLLSIAAGFLASAISSKKKKDD